MASDAPANPTRRRDVRRLALLLTVGVVGVGGYALDRWLGGAETPVAARGAGATEAAEVGSAAVPTRADEIDAHFTQGVLMLHARQYPEAAMAFARVLERAPRMPEAHVNLGFALLGQKQFARALAAFDTATDIKPDQINAYYGMAEAYEGLGDTRGALESMEAFVHLAKPDDPFRRRAEAAIWEWRAQIKAAPAAPVN